MISHNLPSSSSSDNPLRYRWKDYDNMTMRPQSYRIPLLGFPWYFPCILIHFPLFSYSRVVSRTRKVPSFKAYQFIIHFNIFLQSSINLLSIFYLHPPPSKTQPPKTTISDEFILLSKRINSSEIVVFGMNSCDGL